MPVAVLRRDKFTQIDNRTVKYPALSLKAKGLLLVMMSNVNEWEFYLEDICKHSKDGKDAHNSALAELIRHGFVVNLGRKRNEKGHLKNYDLLVSDTPITNEEKDEFLRHRQHSIQSGKSYLGKPAANNTIYTIKNDVLMAEEEQLNKREPRKQVNLADLPHVRNYLREVN